MYNTIHLCQHSIYQFNSCQNFLYYIDTSLYWHIFKFNISLISTYYISQLSYISYSYDSSQNLHCCQWHIIILYKNLDLNNQTMLSTFPPSKLYLNASCYFYLVVSQSRSPVCFLWLLTLIPYFPLFIYLLFLRRFSLILKFPHFA